MLHAEERRLCLCSGIAVGVTCQQLCEVSGKSGVVAAFLMGSACLFDADSITASLKSFIFRFLVFCLFPVIFEPP